MTGCKTFVGGLTHASDFIAIISSAKDRMRFHLQVAAGNQFLVLSGLYPEFLRRRSEDWGGPGLEFYESFAQQAFRSAADSVSQQERLRGICSVRFRKRCPPPAVH